MPSFNAENQITQMDGGAAVYAYDGEGRRMKKTVGSETTYYFYGVGGLLCEFTTTNTGATQAATTDRTTYRTSDKLGSAVLVLNSSGAVIENNRTLPYGEAWLSEAASTNDKKFTTYQRDQESGLDYAINRYFANSNGRFVSVDKGRIDSALPRSLNRYAFSLNDPVNYRDPDGNLPCNDNGASGGYYWETIDTGEGRYSVQVACETPQTPQSRPDRARSARTEALEQWNSLSEDCQKGLTAAMPGTGNSANISRAGALNRALAAVSQLQAAVEGTNISWEMLAAIGIRESGFRNIAQPNGQGRGIFQIDLGAHPNVTQAQARDPSFAAGYAAQLLATNHAILAAAHPNLNSSQLLQATAASYNFGTRNISGNPNTIDVGTTGNNYGSNVMNLMDCFR